ncbi:MAG: prepilin-type N-terminal cleavage/methylation domain-containing protein [Rhizomicrobium sp.]
MNMRPVDGGYTIVEMLVSLMILGMLGTMMLSGVSAGRRVWERTDALDSAVEEVAGAQMLLRQRIEHVYPVTVFETLPPTSDFDGESSTVTFVAPPRDAQSPSALRRYKLWLSPQGELVLSSVSTVSAHPTVADENLVLLAGVQALDLAYFGPDSKGDPGWSLQWSKQPMVPSLIRVHVAFGRGDSRVWPDLLVKPQITIDSDCVFNPATGRCRGRR